MKKILISVALLASLISSYAYAATYTYTGEYFYEAGTPYTTDMRVTASITTSSPIPPNSTNLDISAILTSWSANDGIQTINNTNGVIYPTVPPIVFSTDASGNITAGKFTAIISPIGTVVGDTDDFIWISYDLAAKNQVCTHVSIGNGICDEYGFSGQSYGLAEPTGVWEATNVYAIGPEYSGSWYNPAQSGHGFSLEYSVLDDETPLVVAYWYVYDSEGNPIFIIGLGEPKEGNTVTLKFEAPYGMKFGEFDPESTIRADGGTGVFTFEDSESGIFNYEPSQWMIDTYGVSAISIPVVQLLEVAHPNDEPPTGEPVSLPGSWSGRMTYDRASPAGTACYDADVQVVVRLSSNGAHYMDSITVRPDSGGLYIDNLGSYVTDTWHTNGNVYSLNIDYTIAFNAQGSAEGAWTYSNADCYGEWSFTKD